MRVQRMPSIDQLLHDAREMQVLDAAAARENSADDEGDEESECKQTFKWTAAEQQAYKERSIAGQPALCGKCRARSTSSQSISLHLAPDDPSAPSQSSSRVSCPQFPARGLSLFRQIEWRSQGAYSAAKHNLNS